jgi:hypothetical protein
MIPGSIKGLSILAGLVIGPAVVRASHHLGHRVAQPTDGSGSSILIIILLIAIVGLIWIMTRKK